MRSRDGGAGGAGGGSGAGGRGGAGYGGSSRCAAFDDAAYAALFRDHHGRVVGYLISLDRTLRRSDAEDLAQDSFATTWPRWSQVRDYDQPLGSVIRTAHNLWLNHRRAGLRHPVDPLQERDGWVQMDDDELLEAIELRVALADLSLRQRQVLLLRFFVDLTVPQTAEVLDLAQGTVTWTTSEALAALRRRLDPEGRGRRG